MDLLIILEQVEQKKLSFQVPVPVSAKASHIGGSRVWLAEKEVFPLDEMLYALIVQSANDVATALAEKVAGSTDAFVELMNKRAHELGMKNTVFHSVHGLPGPARNMTSRLRVISPCCVARCSSTKTHCVTLRPTTGRFVPTTRNTWS